MASLRAISVFAAVLTLAHARTWAHPGVVYSADRLAYLSTCLRAGTCPDYVNATLTHALKFSWTQPSYQPAGPPPGGVIDCGYYSNPDIGCNNETTDSASAMIAALTCAITGDTAYEAAAIRVMNAYAYGLKNYTNNNAPLQAAWSLGKWVRTAELLSHACTGAWSPADRLAFIDMLYNVSLPRVYNGSNDNGNWELSMVEGMLGLAVLAEDESLFTHALSLWAARVKAYWYIASDGPKPLPGPHGPVWWYNQYVFNASVNGICQETCRDLGHAQFGFASAMNGAATAALQGETVLEDNMQRLTAAMEFQANLLLGAPAPAYVCNGTGVKVSQAPTYEIAYSELAVARNASLPLSYQHIVSQVRNDSTIVLYMMVIETATHGMPVPLGRYD